MHATTITLTLSSPPLLSAFYEPLWMPADVAGEDFAHIKVRSIYSTAVPLPIANTGLYRNTLPARVITAAGGPVAFIDVMMAAREVHHGEPHHQTGYL